MSLNTTNDLGRTPARSTRRNGGHGIRDVDLPQPRRGVPLDVLAAELARWNYRQERAKDDYYRRTGRAR